jgi:hypothetical protein
VTARVSRDRPGDSGVRRPRLVLGALLAADVAFA